MKSNSSRLQVVDALRGFAIVSIMLLHNLEHFDFYYLPAGLPEWMAKIDKGIWDTMFFLFGGKSYAIFALLFGLTFFIQSHNQEKKGKDFRGRFAWRLVLLLIFGLINSAFYEGDILTIYALTGFFLIPVAKLGNKTVLWIAIILMLQPYEWVNFFMSLQNPVQPADPASWAYFAKQGEYITGNSFWATIVGNLTNGKTAVLYWTWENGRAFQTLSLFMLGMLAGRTSLFVYSDATKRIWKRVLLISAVLFVPLFIIKGNLRGWIGNEAISRPLLTIETTWSNLAFMLILVSGFVLLFQSKIIQSIIGSVIYYGFGLGLYKYTGATYSLFIGVFLAVLQGYFCTWWFKKHNQGPLEKIWHKLTWLGADK
jgi:uncharacterized protein